MATKITLDGKVVELVGEAEANLIAEQALIRDEIKVKSIRFKRDALLHSVVDPIVSNHMRWNDLSAEDQEKIRVYRRALLDVPQQEGYPDSVIWPNLELGE